MNKRYLTALFTVAVQLMTVLMLNQILFASNSDIYYKNLPIIILSLSALAFIFFFSIQYIESSSKKETELELLKCHLRDVEELVKTYRAERHENIQNMQTIQALAFLGKYADLKQYLNKIVGNYRSVEKVLRLGDMALTALVNVKMETMKRNNIDFVVKYSGLGIYNTKPDSFELSTVVGNVLDNAIEAVMERESERIIYFEVDENPKSYIVKISNNGPAIKEADFTKIYEAGYSTKHKDTRGFGLYIVKKIMDKYNGTIQLNSDEKLTSFTLFIPRKGGLDVAEAFSKAVTDTKIPAGM
ncbi:MAG TPA: GHKL domain-containing protein [Thermoanaerobacterales bacterium]|nr:GHKL domain-containing protein [Thermoanaerobacterales bacterium]